MGNPYIIPFWNNYWHGPAPKPLEGAEMYRERDLLLLGRLGWLVRHLRIVLNTKYAGHPVGPNTGSIPVGL